MLAPCALARTCSVLRSKRTHRVNPFTALGRHTMRHACSFIISLISEAIWSSSFAHLYDGVVTAWRDGVHHVKYDAGDSSDWSLYWPSGAPAFVLLDA